MAIIKHFLPTEVIIKVKNKEIKLKTDDEHPFDYDVIEKIWEVEEE